MRLYLFPILYIVLLIWSSTGLIIFLDSLPARTYRRSIAGATVLAVLAFAGLWTTRDDTGVSAAYVAFTCATLIYGWHKMSFYMGLIAGPRRVACPEACGGARHFWHAVQTILYHELLVVVTAIALAAISWGHANQIGLWTFLILWWMQQAARLNVFWGVRNLNAELLPAHLHYLGRYFRRRAINPFFPLSVTIPAITAMLLLGRAFSAASDYEAISLTFLGALLVAAILEIVMLMLPLPERWTRLDASAAHWTPKLPRWLGGAASLVPAPREANR